MFNSHLSDNKMAKKKSRPNIEVKAPSNEQRDHQKFFVEKGDPGFSPEHNKYIIEKTIKEHEANIMKRRKAYVEQVAERSDAAMDYVRYLERGGDSKNPYSAEKYFGRKILAELRGQKIMQKILNDGQVVIEEI